MISRASGTAARSAGHAAPSTRSSPGQVEPATTVGRVLPSGARSALVRSVTAVRAAGATMSVNYTRRWFPSYCEARRIVRSGEIGKLSQIVAISGGPRAMLWRNHTHLIDLMNFLADDEPLALDYNVSWLYSRGWYSDRGLHISL